MVERNPSQKDILSPLRSLADQAAALCEKLRRLDGERSPVRIVVAGGFSAGKSAFVNHLLGKDGIAAEGASATTRCCTEYRYGCQTIFQSGEKVLTQEEYLRLSTEENARQSFRVTIDAVCLKEGIILVDTPGVGATDSDDDLATDAIKSADILLWLVNACGGTILRSELDLLKRAVDDRTEVPLALVLTRIDGIHPDRGEFGCDAVGKIRSVIENVRTLAEEKDLRLVFPPLPFTNKPEKAAPSIKNFVERQDKDLDDLFKESLKKQTAVFEKRKQTTRDELKQVRDEFYNSQRLLADNLADQIKSKQRSIKQAEKRCQEEFSKQLERVLLNAIEELAEITITAAPESPIIQSMPIPGTGSTCPNWRAHFNIKNWENLVWSTLDKDVSRLFRKYTDFSGSVQPVFRPFVKRLGENLTNKNICHEEYDAVLIRGDAQLKARESCAYQLSKCLNSWIEEETGREAFFKLFKSLFSMPRCKWTSRNLGVWRAEIERLRNQRKAVLREECPQYLSPAVDQAPSVHPAAPPPAIIPVVPHPVIELPPLRLSRFVAAGVLVGWAGLHLALAGRWREFAISWLLLTGTFGFEPDRFPLSPLVLLGTFAWWIGTICIVRTEGRGRPMQSKRDSLAVEPTRGFERNSHSDRSRLIYWLLTLTIGFTGLNNRYIRSRREGNVSTALLLALIVFLFLYAIFGTSPWVPLISLDLLAMFLWNIFCILFVTDDGAGRKLRLSS